MGRDVPDARHLSAINARGARPAASRGLWTIDKLDELRLGAGTRGWWSVYKLPEQLDLYVGLEASAVSQRSLALTLIPGLLQTEEYARKVHSLRGQLSPEEVDQRMAVRMQRQQRLTGSSPLQLSVILDEAALLRCARETSVAAGQLQQLLERAQLPNVEVRVIPFDAGLHVGTSGAYSLLSFPGGVLPDVANQEYVAGGHVIDDQTSEEQMAGDLASAPWRKSARSNSMNECVEVADLSDGGRAVRDSKDPAGPALRFTPGEWAAFTAGVRDGEFS